MDKFKKTLQSRIRALCIYNCILLLTVLIGIFHPTAGSSENILEFMSGVNIGVYIMMQAVIVYFLVKYNHANRYEEKLKALYIYENDERRKYINSQIGGLGINIIISGLAIGTIASGFWNEIVYFTLLGTLAFSAFVKAGLKTYYNRKV